MSAEPTPLDGIELRDVIATDHQMNARRRGRELPRTAADKMAVDDILINDAYERNHPVTVPSWPDVAPEDEIPEAVVALTEEQQGVECQKTTNVQDEVEQETLGSISPEKRALLVHRMKLLMSFDEGGDLLYPRYAKMVLEEYADFLRCKADYAFCLTPLGINKFERDRIYFRKLEDICDKSNGHPHLPNWWVK